VVEAPGLADGWSGADWSAAALSVSPGLLCHGCVEHRGLQGILLWAPQGFQLQIDVQIRPMQVMAVQQNHVEYRFDAHAFEPRVVLMIQEILAALDVDPDALGGDALDFSG